jgi:2-(1,2-epoxy-1,2-dihydrophenyl)acetyl-CoA isomerase
LNLRREVDVARIHFARPEKANAIHPDWLPEIIRFLRDAEYDDGIRCVLFSAEGKHFQAGGDLGFDMDQPLPRLVADLHEIMAIWNRLMATIFLFPKPVVAAVKGGTIGASISLVAACDFVVASEDAFFVCGQTRIGASLDGLPSYLLPRKVGLTKAIEWTLLADRISAPEALAAGLINQVVRIEDLESAASSLCARLAKGPTRALGLTKRLIKTSGTRDIEAQGAAEAEAYSAVAATADWKEGVRAFLEKREPRFMGR